MIRAPSRGDVPFPATTAWQGAMRELLEPDAVWPGTRAFFPSLASLVR
jgi:hypothetical protein